MNQPTRQQAMQKTPRFADILDVAWSQHGLKRITTRMEQAPSEANGMLAIFYAEVETDRGTFTAYGDATPRDVKNTSPMIAPHFLRFAESRAIARALRWATNAGEAVDVEMGDYAPKGDDDDPPAYQPRQEQRPNPFRQQTQPAVQAQTPANGRQEGAAASEAARGAAGQPPDPAFTAPSPPPETPLRGECRALYLRAQQWPDTFKAMQLPAIDAPEQTWSLFLDRWAEPVKNAEKAAERRAQQAGRPGR